MSAARDTIAEMFARAIFGIPDDIEVKPGKDMLAFADRIMAEVARPNPLIERALVEAEAFIAGFENDTVQDSIDALLVQVRAALAAVRGGQA